MRQGEVRSRLPTRAGLAALVASPAFLLRSQLAFQLAQEMPKAFRGAACNRRARQLS